MSCAAFDWYPNTYIKAHGFKVGCFNLDVYGNYNLKSKSATFDARQIKRVLSLFFETDRSA